MEEIMKKKQIIFLALGILLSYYGSSFAISSEPVYKGNPEEYLRTEWTKLGFSGLMVSKDGSGRDLYAVSAANFVADSANYKNVIKDVRTAVQKNKTITFKALLQFVAGVKSPYIVVQIQEFKNFGFEISGTSPGFFKFQ
jgi:hypothetical protein